MERHVILAALVVSIAGQARAEPFVQAHYGRAYTVDADLHIVQPGRGTDLVFERVGWKDDWTNFPSWYAVRAGAWLPGAAWLGVAVELLHFKVVAETGGVRRAQGTYRGAPLDADVSIEEIVQSFEVSHGVNYVLAALLARAPLWEGRGERARLYATATLGAGPVIGHAESTIDGVRLSHPYQLAGVGVQGSAGLLAMPADWLGAFLEYKLTRARLEVGVADGDGRLRELTHHICGGVSLHLPSP